MLLPAYGVSVYVVTRNDKIFHLVVVDDSCDVRSIFGPKSVKKTRKRMNDSHVMTDV